MIIFFAYLAASANYAILYCGSSTIWNYRHQADIYTIYNQLKVREFDKSNLILFAYDDLSTDYNNPYKGAVYHLPDHEINVYPGTQSINYRRSSITAQSLYDVIENLPTTKEDYVFIYYIDHGGPGFLGTPENGPKIYGDLLSESIEAASKSNRFKKLLFIIEACYSGSIGQLITTPNVAVITAANESEPSNPQHYDSELDNYLSNEFSNNFIELIDSYPEANIGQLYSSLQDATKQSHAMFYGDESIKSIQLSDFIGKPSEVLWKFEPKVSINSRSYSKSKTTEQILQLHKNHSLTVHGTKAKLQQIKNRALTEQLEVVLESLVRHIDPLNYIEIMNDKKAEYTKEYFKVLPLFFRKVGKINPDDYGRLFVIKALASRHSAEYIIQGLDDIII